MTVSTRVYQPWPGTQPGAWANLWMESCGYRNCRQPTLQVEAGFTCVHLVTHGTVRYRYGDRVDVVLGEGYAFGNWFGDAFNLTAEPLESGADVGLQWIRLFGPAAGDYLGALGLTTERPYRLAADPVEGLRIMRELVRLGRDQPTGAALQSLSLLYALPLACGVTEHASDAPKPLAVRVRAAMMQNIAMGMNVEQVCRAFRVSRTTLFGAVKQQYGMSPMAVLTELRLNHAKRLLRETSLPIAEVAAASGYSEVSYFGRRFRIEVGCTPSEYRRTDRA